VAKPTTEPAEQPQLRPPTPHQDGPLGSSGAAPEEPGGTPEPTGATPADPSGRSWSALLRRANPVPLTRTAGRKTSAWARRPTGRVAVPAIIGVLLVGVAGTAGAYLVPKALQAEATPSATPPLVAAGSPLPVPSGPTAVPSLPAASGMPTVTGSAALPGQSRGRPADALAGWAQQAGTRAGIPVVAVEAYGYAELVLARTAPNCHLAWTTLAALGEVESAHGSAGGAVLGADGSVQPPIFGLPLDGKGGRPLVRDTDQGAIDGITTYDRAVGPMQFIPATWRENAIDADNNGVADPNDIDDAALTAASYLCKNGRDLAKPDAWWDAILSYNAVRPYAQRVFDAANVYGQRSRL
jgi:transglycosylase-like protein with SLT domain